MNETPPNSPSQAKPTSNLLGAGIIRLIEAVATKLFMSIQLQWQTRMGQWGRVWLIGLLVGIAGGYAGVAFHHAIAGLTQITFGAPESTLATAAAQLDRLRLFLTPVVGGILVGALLWFASRFLAMADARLSGVADIIEARALRGGKVSARATMVSSLGSVLALGLGSATGREGPAAFLGAGVGSWLAERFSVSERDRRTLLACGVAAAVAASFNAPLAGALFALEVVLGHYALRTIAPISIAAVAGTLISRLHDASVNLFAMPFHAPRGILDFALATLFGVIAALIAIGFMRALLTSQKRFDHLRQATSLPIFALPAIAGAGVGLIALMRPEVLGVGYEATALALRGEYSFGVLVAILVAKFAATVLCFGGRFGVGVFSPTVMLGAVSGAAFGALVSGFGNASGESLFALIGMGAVAGAVLGAPLSTTLIVFEMTGSYETAVALLVSVSLATIITQSVMGGNIFQLQIEARGFRLADGPQRIILQTTRVSEIMTPSDPSAAETAMEGAFLYEDDTLGKALGMMEAERIDAAPVRERSDERVIGYLSRADALIAYNQRLVAAHEELAR
jgi:chloride channel protein, CIC family